MDAKWVRKPHLDGNTVGSCTRRNGNQRHLHHCKLYGCKSVTYTDPNSDGNCNSHSYGDSDSYTDGDCNSYGYTNCTPTPTPTPVLSGLTYNGGTPFVNGTNLIAGTSYTVTAQAERTREV